MNRPTTPIPYGCTFTLLTCQLNLANNTPSTSLVRMKSEERFGHNEQKTRNQKLSLKYAKSPRHRVETVQNRILNSSDSYASAYSRNNNERSFTEISSVLGPYQTKDKQNKNHQSQTVHKNSFNRQNCPTIQEYPARIPQKVSIIQNPPILEVQSNTNTHIIAQEITLNHLTGSNQLKDRQTTNTNTRTHYFGQQNHKSFVRSPRLNTQENGFPFQSQRIQFRNKPSEIVYRSQFLNSPNKFQHFLKPYALPQPPLHSILKKSQTYQQNLPSPRSFRNMRQSFPFASIQNYNNDLQSNKISMQVEPPGPQIQSQQSLLKLKLKESLPVNTLRRQSSPRIPIKFHTLVDLDCKDVESNGGDKTSSNHISILSNGESLNGSIKQGDNFSKIIKIMTLKNVPLREQF